jgi:hypothetical protein
MDCRTLLTFIHYSYREHIFIFVQNSIREKLCSFFHFSYLNISKTLEKLEFSQRKLYGAQALLTLIQTQPAKVGSYNSNRNNFSTTFFER